jgi:uncharacterized membrane protein YidH (DUF202 family)
MDSLSIVILVLGIGLMVAGVMEFTKSKSRRRSGREQDRRGTLLFLIGIMLCIILAATRLT